MAKNRALNELQVNFHALQLALPRKILSETNRDKNQDPEIIEESEFGTDEEIEEDDYGVRSQENCIHYFYSLSFALKMPSCFFHFLTFFKVSLIIKTLYCGYLCKTVLWVIKNEYN